MRALLVYPNALTDVLIGYGDLGALAEPLALEYLGAGAKLDSHDVHILDLRLHRGALETTIREYRPDVVGVTGYSMHVLEMLRICSQVKLIDGNCVTVVGGHHATLMPEDFFGDSVDYVVCGEGVAPFRELLRQLKAPTGKLGIAGVWSRRGDRFESGGPARQLDIDAVPLPDRSLTGGDRSAYFIDWMKPIALVRTTVGCPYRCNFCSLWSIMDGRYFMRSIDSVVREIDSLEERFVFFVDDEAFINARRMQALAEALSANGIDKRYFAYCRIDTFLRHPKLMEQWREIGLERLFIGVEAPTQRGLNDYNKRLEVAQIERGLRSARDLEIQVFGGFVVNTNYAARDFKHLIRFVEHQRIDYPSFTILTPLPGTEFLTSFDHITELQANGRPDWEKFDLQHAVTATALPHEEFMRHYRDLYHVFSDRYALHRDRVRLRDVTGAFVA